MHNQVAQTEYPDPYQSDHLFSSSMTQYSLQAPFQADFTPAMPIYHSVNNGQPAPGPGESRMCFPLERVVAPAVKVEMPSPTYASLSPPHRGESITSFPQPVQGNRAEFNTRVDTLMKAIQAKQKLVPQQMKHISEDAKEQTRSQKKPRKYECLLQDCNKRFCQKTQLVIHMRSHTGEKPHVCRHPGCGQSFSQLGNLRTHERRHTGERPYNCDICGKSFAQRRNVREHQIVHQQIKRFTCELDKCGKRFTQRGNLKNHQNRSHADTIAELTKKFTSIQEIDNATDEDRKLWEYFASMYKNLNKGIRGRGKYRWISVASSTTTMVPSARQDSMDTGIYTLSASKSRCSALPLAGFEMAAGYTGSSGYENGVFPDRESASSQSSRRSSLSSAGLIQADDGYDFNGDMARGYTASSDYKNEVFPERAA